MHGLWKFTRLREVCVQFSCGRTTLNRYQNFQRFDNFHLDDTIDTATMFIVSYTCHVTYLRKFMKLIVVTVDYYPTSDFNDYILKIHNCQQRKHNS